MFDLHRIDLLIHQPADELLHPAIDLAVEQRCRHVEGDSRGQLFEQLAAHFTLGLVPGLVLEIALDARAQRVEVLELPHVLRELVVELRHERVPDGFHRDRVLDGRAGELLDRVVLRITDVERLFAPPQADQLLVEPGRIRRGADLDRDAIVLVGLRLAGVARVGSPAMTISGSCFGTPCAQIHHDRIAVVDAAAFDRFVARRAFAQALQRLVDRRVLDCRGLRGAA